MMKLATMGDRAGVDLWGYRTPDGRSLRRALDFLAPYVDPAKDWPHMQIAKADRASLLPLLLQAAVHYREPAYRSAVERFGPGERAARWRLLYPDGRPCGALSDEEMRSRSGFR